MLSDIESPRENLIIILLKIVVMLLIQGPPDNLYFTVYPVRRTTPYTSLNSSLDRGDLELRVSPPFQDQTYHISLSFRDRNM